MKLTTQIALVILVFSLYLVIPCEVSIYETSKSISYLKNFLIKHFSLILKKTEFGCKNNSCKEVSFETTNNFTGKDHLYIKWDASKCNYVALGLKWNNFKGKNLKAYHKIDRHRTSCSYRLRDHFKCANIFCPCRLRR